MNTFYDTFSIQVGATAVAGWVIGAGWIVGADWVLYEEVVVKL